MHTVGDRSAGIPLLITLRSNDRNDGRAGSLGRHNNPPMAIGGNRHADPVRRGIRHNNPPRGANKHNNPPMAIGGNRHADPVRRGIRAIGSNRHADPLRGNDRHNARDNNPPMGMDTKSINPIMRPLMRVARHTNPLMGGIRHNHPPMNRHADPPMVIGGSRGSRHANGSRGGHKRDKSMPRRQRNDSKIIAVLHITILSHLL